MNIWGTVEMTCAARGFDYADYVDLHSKDHSNGAVLSHSGYKLLVGVFDNELTEYYKGQEDAPYKLEPEGFLV